jgi:hypothetical protein
MAPGCGTNKATGERKSKLFLLWMNTPLTHIPQASDPNPPSSSLAVHGGAEVKERYCRENRSRLICDTCGPQSVGQKASLVSLGVSWSLLIRVYVNVGPSFLGLMFNFNLVSLIIKKPITVGQLGLSLPLRGILITHLFLSVVSYGARQLLDHAITRGTSL